MKLDALDLKILTALQRDGRMTKLRLSEAVNLSPSACFERVKRLESAGYIRGYHADVDIGRIVKTSAVLVEVSLKSHASADFARFEAAIRDTPEILDCWAVGGGPDYLLRVIARDIDHYQALIDGLLAADIGIQRYYTYIVTKTVKRQSGYPVHYLLEQGGGPAAEPAE
jgi:Lrp/AsnC family transcriptional regulator of ectoine degradation